SERNTDDLDDERAEYLEKNCGITSSSDDDGSSDDGDSPSISVKGGAEGLRQLLQLIAAGSGGTVTDEQIDCAVKALDGKLTDADIQGITTGQISQEGSVAFALALVGCNIDFGALGS
ncbi:MAG TPA: hypothetical protein PLV68_13960, partial [Ilumatobacteraceae bacterium]|nr:hypothetical protein [Ilumatobacteraceae bacterium]